MAILGRIARSLGVVRVSRHEVALQQLRRAESHVDRLQRELDRMRLASGVWKAKSDAAARRAQPVERLRRQLQKVSVENARLRTRLLALVDRVTTAERDVATARDNLMAVEVKLDILEGAAVVLDQRTRTDLTRDPRYSVSP